MAGLADLLPPPYRLQHLDSVDSTNAEARRQVENGQAQASLIWADTQSAGKGRRDRAWQSPAGNIAATLVQPWLEPVDQAGQHGFMLALAIATTFDDMAGSAEAQLKWPNDVLVDGAKLSGILLEIAYDPSGAPWLVSGFGVNVASAPTSENYRTTSFAEHMPVPPVENVLTAILEHYFALWDIQSDEGFGPIRDLWLEKAVRLGEEIAVRLPDGTETGGIFHDLTADGSLSLQIGAETRLITAGDVYFPELAANDR